jgi:hypothetical protein
MTDLRAAAQQALEALEDHAKQYPHMQKGYTVDAISALKAALEQPVQEPVATVAMDVSRAHLSWDGKYLGQRPDMKIAMLLKDLPVGTLLFTHPPRREWRGLTDTERAAVQYESFKRGLSPLEFMELHEAKLKELNA